MPPLFTLLLLGIAIGFFLARGFRSRLSDDSNSIQPPPQPSTTTHSSATRTRGDPASKGEGGTQTEKDMRKQSIIQYLKEHGSITNDNVEELLGVADTAAYNYLEALEQEGKIEQIGKTGKHVKYRLR